MGVQEPVGGSPFPFSYITNPGALRDHGSPGASRHSAPLMVSVSRPSRRKRDLESVISTVPLTIL